MEGDRKAYSEESQNTIRKQRDAIKALQDERTELMKYIRLAGSQQNLGKVLSSHLRKPVKQSVITKVLCTKKQSKRT